MSWYIGQEIVCIDAEGATTESGSIHSGLKEGKVYTITGLAQSCCYIRIDIGIKSHVSTQICSECRTKSLTEGKWLFKESRFRPLDELADITELTEILENTKPYEVK